VLHKIDKMFLSHLIRDHDAERLETDLSRLGTAHIDRPMLEQHLGQAESHVTEGENYITRQLQLLAELAEGVGAGSS
jgi:hypothetical protein